MPKKIILIRPPTIKALLQHKKNLKTSERAYEVFTYYLKPEENLVSRTLILDRIRKFQDCTEFDDEYNFPEWIYDDEFLLVNNTAYLKQNNKIITNKNRALFEDFVIQDPSRFVIREGKWLKI